MATRLLLIGNDNNTKDLFFDKLSGDFSCVTSSKKSMDLKWHVDAFKPDAIVYCMLDEDEKYFNSLANFRREVLGSDRHFIAVGSRDEIDAFQNMTARCADIQIFDPESAIALKDSIKDAFTNPLKYSGQNPSPSVGNQQQAASWNDILSQLEGEAGAVRKHILVIDDDPLMLKVIKDYLHENYEVAAAKSGSVAYKFLEKKSTDLILLDYEMPDEKGPDVLKKIREIPGRASIPVIFLTGVKDKERLVEIVKVKPQGYLNKPVERQALYDMIAKVMPD